MSSKHFLVFLFGVVFLTTSCFADYDDKNPLSDNEKTMKVPSPYKDPRGPGYHPPPGGEPLYIPPYQKALIIDGRSIYEPPVKKSQALFPTFPWLPSTMNTPPSKPPWGNTYKPPPGGKPIPPIPANDNYPPPGTKNKLEDPNRPGICSFCHWW